jgi:hypothetical protein
VFSPASAQCSGGGAINVGEPSAVADAGMAFPTLILKVESI